MTQRTIDYYLILDFEATCEKDNAEYVNEIIEFPIVVIDAKTKQLAPFKFHSHVKPTQNTILSAFCTELTGITQAQIANAPLLPQVLQQVHQFLQNNKLIPDTLTLEQTYTAKYNDKYQFCFVTDGPWDFTKFLQPECKRKGISVPNYYLKWCNLRSFHATVFNVPNMGIKKMLLFHKLQFEGKEHSGLDDALNLARITCKVLEHCDRLSLNHKLSIKK